MGSNTPFLLSLKNLKFVGKYAANEIIDQPAPIVSPCSGSRRRGRLIASIASAERVSILRPPQLDSFIKAHSRPDSWMNLSSSIIQHIGVAFRSA
jgi:hypothetical protein